MSFRACLMWVSTGLLSLLLSIATAAQKPDDTADIKDFQARISRYVALQKQQDLPNQATSSPSKLAEQEQQRVEKARKAHPAGHQGDIFTPEIAAYFKRQIAATMRGPDGRRKNPRQSPPCRASAEHSSASKHEISE